MVQTALFTEWRADMPPVEFDPDAMVATTSLMGEPAAVVMLAGEPWMGVVQVGGVRRVVMWSRVEYRAALSRVVTAAGELGLRVLPPKGCGCIRVARVPIAVTHQHYQGQAAAAYRRTIPVGIQLVSAGERVRDRAVRSGLLAAVRAGRRDVVPRGLKVWL